MLHGLIWLAATACLGAVWSWLRAREHAAGIRRRLGWTPGIGPGPARDRGAPSDGTGPRGLLPLAVAGWAERLAPLVAGRDELATAARLLHQAGAPPWLSAPVYAALRLSAGLAGALAGVVLCAGGGPPWLLMAVGAAGYWMPDLWLRRAAAGWQREAGRQAPALLELLAMGLGAGASADTVIRVVGAHLDGSLAAEWAGLVADLDLGMPRQEALQRLADRTGLPVLAWLAGTLGQGTVLGAPLAGELDAEARDQRMRRLTLARERVGRAIPRITLVSVFVLTPSALLLLTGLIALHLLEQTGIELWLQ